MRSSLRGRRISCWGSRRRRGRTADPTSYSPSNTRSFSSSSKPTKVWPPPLLFHRHPLILVRPGLAGGDRSWLVAVYGTPLEITVTQAPLSQLVENTPAAASSQSRLPHVDNEWRRLLINPFHIGGNIPVLSACFSVNCGKKYIISLMSDDLCITWITWWSVHFSLTVNVFLFGTAGQKISGRGHKVIKYAAHFLVLYAYTQ